MKNILIVTMVLLSVTTFSSEPRSGKAISQLVTDFDAPERKVATHFIIKDGAAKTLYKNMNFSKIFHNRDGSIDKTSKYVACESSPKRFSKKRSYKCEFYIDGESNNLQDLSTMYTH